MKKMAIAISFILAITLFSACTQFEVTNVLEIRLISREESIKAVLYPEDEDYEVLVEICNGRIYKEYSGCPFGISIIQFVTDDETINIYPTGDGCSKFAVGELASNNLSLVSLPKEKMEIIYAILQKYGIQTEGA